MKKLLQSLILSSLSLTSFAQNPEYHIEDYDDKPSNVQPCFLGWNTPGSFQGHVGHDFTNMHWDEINGTFNFDVTTHATNHGPLFYILSMGDDFTCDPGQGLVDITNNPRARVRIKASEPMTVNMYLQEGNAASWDYSKFANGVAEMDLTTNYKTFEITITGNSNLGGLGTVDLTQIGVVAFELGKSNGVDYDQIVGGEIMVDFIEIGVESNQPDSCNFLRTSYEMTQKIDCQNTSAIIKVSGKEGNPGYIYNWLSAGTELNDSTLEVSTPGFYEIEITDQKTCKDTTSIYVNNGNRTPGFDLSPVFIGGNFRTGFTRLNKVNFQNSGCNAQSGKVYVVLDEHTTYSSSASNPDEINGDTLIWNYSNLSSNDGMQSFSFDIKTDVNTQIGDTVCIMAWITPKEGDENMLNNRKTYCFPVINGYDPNDIAVNPTACPDGFVLPDDVLTYKIRFQNTGNAEAININVYDTISKHLDMSTFRVLGSSHSLLQTHLLNDSVLKFAFDDIWLKDSTTNEPESHGYVIYEITPKSGLPLGTEIFNQADIYFDYNPAVETNTVKTTITDVIPQCRVAVSTDVVLKNPSKIYPNPNNGSFNILFETPLNNATIQLVNIEGKVIAQIDATGKMQYSFSEELSRGLYFVNINSTTGSSSVKMMVK